MIKLLFFVDKDTDTKSVYGVCTHTHTRVSYHQLMGGCEGETTRSKERVRIRQLHSVTHLNRKHSLCAYKYVYEK